MITPIHLKKKVKGDYRLIAISDIHGHLDYLKALLQKIKYTPEDYLVIVGDFVEKGDQVIDTIHYIQKLDQNRRTYVLTGNCEWALTSLLTVPELAGQIPRYLRRVSSNGAIREVYHLLHLDDGRETLLGVQKQIADYLSKEIKYISHLPMTLKFNEFLFVHAGIEKRKDYENSSLQAMLEMQYFYNQGHLLNETVIVGHLPTSNYSPHCIQNEIFHDHKKKIICIDGGVGVKPISQLNALIIESKENNITLKNEYFQPLPIYTVKHDIYYQKQTIHKIGYPYFQVTIEKPQEQFSLCFQKDTHQTLWIKNEFLYERNNQIYCLDDYTDCMLSAKKGDQVKVIGIYDQYVYAILNQQIGWIKCINLSMKL